jgi:hypothetical protein
VRLRGLLSASFLCCGGLHHGAVGKFPAVQVQVQVQVLWSSRARETRYIHIESHGRAPNGIAVRCYMAGLAMFARKSAGALAQRGLL